APSGTSMIATSLLFVAGLGLGPRRAQILAQSFSLDQGLGDLRLIRDGRRKRCYETLEPVLDERGRDLVHPIRVDLLAVLVEDNGLVDVAELDFIGALVAEARVKR